MSFKSYEVRLRITVDDELINHPNRWLWDALVGDDAALTDMEIIPVPTDASAIPILRERRHREKQKRN
jgi:hypothetical protein